MPALSTRPFRGAAHGSGKSRSRHGHSHGCPPALPADTAATWSNDSLTFTARCTGTHTVAIFNYPGSGYLEGAVTTSSSKGPLFGTGSRGDGSGPSESPPAPAGAPEGAHKLAASERAADSSGDGRLDAQDIRAIPSNIWNGVATVTADCSGDGRPTAEDLACTIPAVLFP